MLRLSNIAFAFWLLWASAAHAFDACNPTGYTPIDSRYKTGLIFKIERCGKPSSYIFGTMHSDDPALSEILAKAVSALQATTQAGFEIVPKPEDVSIVLRYMYFAPDSNRSLRALIGETHFAAFYRQLLSTRPTSEAEADKMKPWAAAVMLELPPKKSDGVSLDEKLMQQANAHGKKLFALESMEEQFSILDNLALNTQVEMLKDSLTNKAVIDAMNVKLQAAYIAQDLNTIEKLGEEGFAELQNEALRNELKEKLIFARNRNMTNRMQDELARGSTFIAIGALHLPGDKGILKLLEDKGYFISPAE